MKAKQTMKCQVDELDEEGQTNWPCELPKGVSITPIICNVPRDELECQ